MEHQKHTDSIYIYTERYISARQPAPTNNTHTHSPTHAQIYIDLWWFMDVTYFIAWYWNSIAYRYTKSYREIYHFYDLTLSGGGLSSQRTPAWCDRILFRHEPAQAVSFSNDDEDVEDVERTVEVVEYDSYPLKFTSSWAFCHELWNVMNKNERLIWLNYDNYENYENYENYWVIVGFNMCFCDLLWVFEARKICCNYLWLLAEPQLSQQMENNNIVNSVTVSSGPKIINRYHLSKKKSLYEKHFFGPPKTSDIIHLYIYNRS